jgi:very-short-patch-repair endonuclease
MSGDDPGAPTSLPSGEGRGGVRRASADLPSWGRPDAVASVKTARALRRRMTPQEAKVRLRLKALRHQGFHFRRQVPIGKFIVDFACLRAGLIVEVDGGQHNSQVYIARDNARDAALVAAGFKVLRFWNAEVDADPDSVAETVFARLTARDAALRHTPPQPSPEGREDRSVTGEIRS